MRNHHKTAFKQHIGGYYHSGSMQHHYFNRHRPLWIWYVRCGVFQWRYINRIRYIKKLMYRPRDTSRYLTHVWGQSSISIHQIIDVIGSDVSHDAMCTLSRYGTAIQRDTSNLMYHHSSGRCACGERGDERNT